MSKTLVVPDDVYENLSRGARQRGVTVKSLLKNIAELVVPRVPITVEDHRRGEAIERLFARGQEGTLSSAELAELDRLIDRHYEVAMKRAEKMIAEKERVAKRRKNGTKGTRRARANNFSRQ